MFAFVDTFILPNLLKRSRTHDSVIRSLKHTTTLFKELSIVVQRQVFVKERTRSDAGIRSELLVMQPLWAL